MFKMSVLAKCLAASLVAGVTAASAVPIVGTANLSLGLVLVSAGEIDWNAPLNPSPNAFKTYGDFVTSAGSNSGSFATAAFTGFTFGDLQDMSANPADANYLPVGPSNTLNVLKFDAQPGWSFSVTNMASGSFPFAPYILTEQGGNVSATISVSGLACDMGVDLVCDPTDDVTQWTGIFSAQYTNITIAQMVAIIEGGGSLRNNTWSGTIEASANRIPEPATLALVGLALAGLGVASRRRRV